MLVHDIRQQQLGTVDLVDDFDDVLLQDNPVKAAHAVTQSVAALEYFDSAASSRSNTEDEDTHSSTAEDDDSSSPSSPSSPSQQQASQDQQQANDQLHHHLANKLNGFAISSLKSRSSISLLSSTQPSPSSSRKSRYSRDTIAMPLFAAAESNRSTPPPPPPPPPRSSASTPTPVRRWSEPNGNANHASSNGIGSQQVSPTTTMTPPSGRPASLMHHHRRSQTTQGWPTTATAAHPQQHQPFARTMSLSAASSKPSLQPHRFNAYHDSTGQYPQPYHHQDTSPLSLPFTKHGLTPQQRLRLRRHSAGTGTSSGTGSRLTVKQRELQCDYDEGEDDIPADSLAWNVPLSPALYAKTQMKRSASSLSFSSSSRSKSAPMSRRDSVRTLDNLSSIKESEPTLFFSSQAGLEYLSEDARLLTRVFQDLSPTKPSTTLNKPSKRLPPKRRSSDLMDPVPISREKDAVLSRTRPSWLPPKPTHEERRHVHEYQQMMAHAAHADEARARRLHKQQTAQTLARQRDEREWETKVMPGFERAMQLKTTRDLVWRSGVPQRFRTLVWHACAGNRAGVTAATYNQALARGRAEMAALAAPQSSSARELSPEQTARKRMLAQLVADSHRTLAPDAASGAALRQQLVDVLTAFVQVRPDIGYGRGINAVAGMLLASGGLKPADAFTALVAIMDRPLCQALFGGSGPGSAKTEFYTLFLRSLNAKLPALYAHLSRLGLPPAAYLEPLLASSSGGAGLFAGRLEDPIATRVYDLLMFGLAKDNQQTQPNTTDNAADANAKAARPAGEFVAALVKTSLAVLTALEPKLSAAKTAREVLETVGWRSRPAGAKVVLEVGEEEAFMALVRNVLKKE